jgi:MFS family permease
MLVGTTVTAISGCLYIYISSLGLLLMLRFFHGLSTGWRPVGTTAYLSDIIPKNRRGEALGYLGIAGSTGSALGPYLGSLVKEEISFDAMFITSSVMGLASLLMTLTLKESLPNAQKFKLTMLKLKGQQLVSKSAYPALIAVTLETFGFGVVITVSPDFVGNLGFNYKGVFMLIVVVSSIFSRFFSGRASDRMEKTTLLIIGMLGGAISLVFLGFCQTKAQVVMAAIFYGLSIGITRPTIFAWTADLAEEGKLALGLSTMLIGLEIGIMMGAVISGDIYSGDVKNIYLTYWLAGIVSLIAALYLFIRQKKLA